MDAETRRVPTSAAPSLESNPALMALIRGEIARTGPITFARFMELALYAPGLGYYVSSPTRIGRGGDFLTAPETHPIFGAAIARQVTEVWRRLDCPADFTIREYGAGSGALAQALATALAADEPGLAASVRYEAVEINPHRRDDIARRLSTAAPGLRFEVLDPAVAPISASPSGAFVLANEFFDAFPVHLVQQTEDGLREVFVDRSGQGFVDVLGPPSTSRLAERLMSEEIRLEPGQRAEIALGLDDWFTAVGSWLRSGIIVVIDYGYPAAELYGSRRRAGTLMAYLDHRAIDNPLVAVGHQDMTAHVDFTALARAAAGAGFATLGLTTQAQFLVNLGLEDLLERARSNPGQSLGQYLELRSGVVRLLDPRHTGGFRVLVLRKGLDTSEPLLGMQRLGP